MQASVLKRNELRNAGRAASALGRIRGHFHTVQPPFLPDKASSAPGEDSPVAGAVNLQPGAGVGGVWDLVSAGLREVPEESLTGTQS